jgi:hypothetical protein
MTVGPNFAFIAIPRTASTAMVHKFLPQFGGQPIGHHHARKVPKGHEHKFTFTVVRNPYDRMLSIWHHLRVNDQQFGIAGMTFPQWMEFMDKHWGWGGWNQTRFLEGLRVDAELRYERLADDVEDKLPFNRRLARPWPKQRVNAALRKPWRKEITPEYINIINWHSEPDFEEFGYTRLEDL